MAKDPAFLFYSQDFYTGVADLNFEERGQYITILCLMHQKGRLSTETIRFCVGSVSVMLKSKFKVDEKGFWYNVRLEKEISARANFTNSRRVNGLKGGRPKTDRLATKNHMEDVNDNANEVEKVIVDNDKDRKKNEFLKNQRWKEEFCMAKNLQLTDLEKLQTEFISDCDLKGEYVDSYKRYFTNWFNKRQQHGTHKQSTAAVVKLGTSDARVEALRKW